MEVQIDLFAEVDRIVDERTSADDIKLACENVRRVLNGSAPSVTLRYLAIAGQRDIESLEDKIEHLQQQVIELVQEKAELESELEKLRVQLHDITNRTIQPVNNYYTMEQFMFVLLRRLRRSYGWRTDYIIATQQTPGCTPVLNETLQKWKNRDQVPDWAVEQIERLHFPERTGLSGVPWTEENEAYLISLYTADPLQSNQTLAHLCEQHFNRPIGENAIKGALDRLRRQDRLPKKRPRARKIL
jgi:hypothetical protein